MLKLVASLDFLGKPEKRVSEEKGSVVGFQSVFALCKDLFIKMFLIIQSHTAAEHYVIEVGKEKSLINMCV